MVMLSCHLAGCMVGPDFHKPAAPKAQAYNQHPLPKKTANTTGAGNAGIAQVYARGRDIPADWWRIFHSSAINQLVNTGIKNSPTMTSAQAALTQAQETLYAQIGNTMVPAFDLGLSGERQRFPGASFPGNEIPSSIFNTFSAAMNVSYTLDIFGGLRREIEALQAQVDYQQFELLATYLSLTSNIVASAINVASFEAQIKATVALIAAEEGQLKIIKQQYQLGGVADTNVLSQQTLVNQARATLPPLQKSLSQSKHALAVLIGDTPNTRMPNINLDKLRLPKDIPVSLPSQLVNQRPDVRASEALLHAASAQVGVATANLFPQFTITGGYGWSATQIPNLFGNNTKTWNLIGQLTQPVFHGGALLAQRRAAIAAYQQAGAQYKQTVLQAFQNVADTLRALDTDARSFRDQKSAERAAHENAIITAAQYRVGGVSYADLLLAQQNYQQTRISSIQAQALRYSDTVALYQALGGGWWNRTASKCDAANRTNANLKCP